MPEDQPRALDWGFLLLRPFSISERRLSPRPVLIAKLPTHDQWESEMVKLRKVRKFVRDESGATAIEYGLIAALIAVVIIGALSSIGSNLNVAFTDIGTNLAGTTR